MLILGINAFHGDSSAALLRDGQLIAAVEEERFNRVKHWAGFPAESIRWCLQQGGIGLEEVEHVAISFNPKANVGRKALFTVLNRPSLKSVVDRLKRQGKSLGLREHLADACGCTVGDVRAQIHSVEHHDAHIASGFLVSPFSEAAILSIDGMGDFVSTVLAFGRDREVDYLSRVFYPHSVGFLYNALTLYLGFPNYGDEYKVMGLAPYGKPSFVEQFRKIILPTDDGFELNLDYFLHQKNGISMSWENGSPVVLPFHSPELEKLLGPARLPKGTTELPKGTTELPKGTTDLPKGTTDLPKGTTDLPKGTTDLPMTERHNDIAASLQVVTEEIVFHLLRILHRKTNCANLVLTGGVAMNSVANGKVTTHTPFQNVYIPAGAADNGTSFGAAFWVWNKVLDQPRSFHLEHGYWGPEYTDAECERAVHARPVTAEKLEPTALIDKVVDHLCQGEVIGWFEGRSEFGARALGNRSLIADPRRVDMRDIINLKIKFREKFRPFAPSILEEHVAEFFEIDAPSPFMEKVFLIRPEKRSLIPAVTHVDGTGRLQSVSRKTNPLYHALISAFHRRTGIPILLNTSLNENEPIVHTPEQAIDCMLRTKMDAIVLGSWFVKRR